MVINNNRTSAELFSTDPVAHSVRAFSTPSARLHAPRPERALPYAGGRDDFARLYPSLFAVEGRASVRSRAARATAVALTAAGSVAAAFLAIFHK